MSNKYLSEWNYKQSFGIIFLPEIHLKMLLRLELTFWKHNKANWSLCCYLLPKSCLTLCDPGDCSTPNFSISQTLLGLISIESMMSSNHLILCRPLLLLPLVFPSIRVFSNESALHIRWPKYWSFSFSISPNEYSGLISFRIYWFDFLLKSLL